MTRVRLLDSDTIVTSGADGVVYARCPHPLGPYARTITERLEHWAEHAPDRTFLARRDQGEWRRLTFGDALRRTRAVAQSLVDRGISSSDTVVILSGNSLEHALLALACMHSGITYARVAPSYSLLARDHTTLRAIWKGLRPRLVFAAEADLYDRALASVLEGREQVVTCTPDAGWTPFTELESSTATAAVDEAHARVGPDTIAKILYTSGSTGSPKGVINTHRMLCSNQEMLCTVMPFLREEPPVLCDWLPWNHTFGGNHNFGIVLYNCGTMYIDDGKPTPSGFETTIANLKEIASTEYYNVPRGYDLLVPRLRAEPEFAAHFFSRLKMLFCAAASLRQAVADDLPERRALSLLLWRSRSSDGCGKRDRASVRREAFLGSAPKSRAGQRRKLDNGRKGDPARRAAVDRRSGNHRKGNGQSAGGAHTACRSRRAALRCPGWRTHHRCVGDTDA